MHWLPADRSSRSLSQDRLFLLRLPLVSQLLEDVCKMFLDHGGQALLKEWRPLGNSDLARLAVEDVAHPRRMSLGAAACHILNA